MLLADRSTILGVSSRLNLIFTAIAISLLSVSIFFWAQLSGLERGFFYGVFEDPPNQGFAADGPNYYQSLNVFYFWMSVCVGICLSASFVKNKFIRVVCILLLAFVTISTWNNLEYKNAVVALRSGFYFPYPWLKTSIYFDWYCLLAAAALLFIEVWAMRSAMSSSSAGG